MRIDDSLGGPPVGVGLQSSAVRLARGPGTVRALLFVGELGTTRWGGGDGVRGISEGRG